MISVNMFKFQKYRIASIRDGYHTWAESLQASGFKSAVDDPNITGRVLLSDEDYTLFLLKWL